MTNNDSNLEDENSLVEENSEIDCKEPIQQATKETSAISAIVMGAMAVIFGFVGFLFMIWPIVSLVCSFIPSNSCTFNWY